VLTSPKIPVMSEKPDIWGYLASRRAAHGWTTREAARRASEAGYPISHGTVAAAEMTGSPISLKTFRALAAAYGDDVDKYLEVAGYARGDAVEEEDIDYLALLERDERLRPDVRAALRQIIEAELARRES
jgi:transcriptional regulator with XRE-family HTH domain